MHFFCEKSLLFCCFQGPLSFSFVNLITICLRIDLFKFILLAIFWVSWTHWFMSFINFGNFSVIIFLNICSATFPQLLFWDSLYTKVVASSWFLLILCTWLSLALRVYSRQFISFFWQAQSLKFYYLICSCERVTFSFLCMHHIYSPYCWKLNIVNITLSQFQKSAMYLLLEIYCCCIVDCMCLFT